MTREEIAKEADKFVNKFFTGWRVFCLTCRGLNCKNNKTCIHCNTKLK